MLFESQSFGEVEKNSFNCLPSKGGHIRLMPWGSSDGKESTCTAGDMGSIPGLGRCPGGGHSSPLQYFYLENPHGQRYMASYGSWGRLPKNMTGETQESWYPKLSSYIPFMLKTWPLCTSAELNLRDRVSGEVENSSLVLCQVKEMHTVCVPQNSMP